MINGQREDGREAANRASREPGIARPSLAAWNVALIAAACALLALSRPRPTHRCPDCHLVVADVEAHRRDGDRQARPSGELAAVRVPRREEAADRLFARHLRSRRRRDRPRSRQGAHRRIPARHAREPLRARPLRGDRPRMRLDDQHRRPAQGRRLLADDVRHGHQAPRAPRQRHPVACAISKARRSCSRAARCRRLRSRSSPSGRSCRSSSSSAPITTSRSRRSRRARRTRSRTTTCSSTACWRKRDRGSDFRVVGDFLTYADYALMLRKDDPEFAEVVERAFHKLAGSREIVAIYERWFTEAAAVGRAAQSADEPAPGGDLPGAGAAGRLKRATNAAPSRHARPPKPKPQR